MRRLFAAAACALALHAAADDDLAAHLVSGARPQDLQGSFTGALVQRLPHRLVPAGKALALPRGAEPAFTYRHDGETRTVADYLARRAVTGLLVLHDGALVLERYERGTDEATRFLSASMAKSVVGLLVGIAAHEGAIRSLDDTAQAYVPALAGTPYGEASVRQLLRMTSGAQFAERYDGADDLGRLITATVGQASAGGAEVLRPYTRRRAAPGAVFYYASADTQALGLVLAAATGMPVAQYMASRLWQPLGAEADAAFLVDAAGQEAVFAFLHARLRDFARLGLLLANDGAAAGRQVVPAPWVREATQAVTPAYVASDYFGYGHHFWVFPGPRRQFAMLGVRGQVVFVDPALKLVLVQAAVWPSAGDRQSRAELLALWRALVAHYGG
jgi:CubicO group peptidase (beta-lactamase class C family)